MLVIPLHKRKSSSDISSETTLTIESLFKRVENIESILNQQNVKTPKTKSHKSNTPVTIESSENSGLSSNRNLIRHDSEIMEGSYLCNNNVCINKEHAQIPPASYRTL